MPRHATRGDAESTPPAQAPSKPDDFTLVTRAKAGERDAFGLLVQRYGNAVLNLIDKMIRDRTVVEDLWQETFVRALENLATYQPRPTTGGAGIGFASWLYRIASNLTLDELRRRKRWSLLSWDLLRPRSLMNEVERHEPYDPPSEGPDAPALLEVEEDILQVRQALDTLPPDWRMILLLREYQDLPYEEIADILGVPLGTVRSRLARAREQLRRALLQETSRRKAS